MSYRPARLNRLAELVPWNQFLNSLKVKKSLALQHKKTQKHYSRTITSTTTIKGRKGECGNCKKLKASSIIVNTCIVKRREKSLGTRG